MSLKEKLEIILITYNRKKPLQKTLEQLFAEDSPVKDLDITILDNHSTDGTTELVKSFANEHKNLKHIVHRLNIGACANVNRAYEIAQKPYMWILCDNDCYDWTSFHEVEEAIDKGCGLILSHHIEWNDKNKWGNLFQIGSYLPACIIKTSEITSTYLINAYLNGETCFPQLAIIAKFINEDKDFYSVKKTIVNWCPNTDSMLRGHDETLSESRRTWFWLWGYVRSTVLIADKEKRNSVLRSCYHFVPSVFGSFLREMISAHVCKKLRFKHVLDILWLLPFDCQLRLILAFLIAKVKYSAVKRGFFSMDSKEKWHEYFEYVNQQKYIDELAKKYKNKKVLLYGAGMFFEALNEYCDLSKLNVIAISDKKFQTEQEFVGYRAIPPQKLEIIKPDVIMFSLAETKFVEKALSHLKFKKIPLLKNDKSVVIF